MGNTFENAEGGGGSGPAARSPSHTAAASAFASMERPEPVENESPPPAAAAAAPTPARPARARPAKRPRKSAPAAAAPPAPGAAVDPAASTAADVEAAAAPAGAAAAPAAASSPPAAGDEDVPLGTLVLLRTSHSQQWRTLADALKDLVPECPVTFGADGLKLVSMDPGMIALICWLMVGLNVAALYRMLRNLTTGGYILELSIHESTPDRMSVVVSNGEKRVRTCHSLKLLRLPEEIITIPPAVFQRVLSIPSADFQRYVRELSGVSNRIRVRSSRDRLTLSATGVAGLTEIEIRPTASGMHWQFIEPPPPPPPPSAADDAPEPSAASADGASPPAAVEDPGIDGVFLSKYLERFSRPLDSIVEIFLKRDYPLVLRYTMQTTVVRLVVAQCEDEAPAPPPPAGPPARRQAASAAAAANR
ncbi:hypothetical protein JKP88DRAFT_272179 [Tribonema minus]|uniref:Proliferating cell nuclear antigen PCNA C-terminal domain-containing protein n=1 Tax=Tribonema minus TaxID=303371 RepID=A0A836CPH7_9STRA|nr:hypothetical protein JKP88DRAFT_272179 [Tribonema minus]